MNETKRKIILTELRDGEIRSGHKAPIEWGLGKLLFIGVTEKGFPYVVWESTKFGSIQVGKSRDGVKPQSQIRNDTHSQVLLNTIQEVKWTAEKMSQELV